MSCDNALKFPTDLPGHMHATAVSYLDRGLLFVGPSGTGKSSLALQMMALGAGLISDDIVALVAGPDGVTAQRPRQAPQDVQIEARGFGHLRARPAGPATLCAVVNLGQTEKSRLPRERTVQIGPFHVPYFHKVESPAFPAILMLYLSQSDAQKE